MIFFLKKKFRKPQHKNSTDKSSYSCYYHYQHCNMPGGGGENIISRKVIFLSVLSALIHLTVTQWLPVLITRHYTEKTFVKGKKCRQGMWLNGPNWLNCLKFRSRSSTLSIPGCGCVSTCGALAVVPNVSRGLRGSSGRLDTSKRENTFAMKPRLREKDDWGFLMPPRPHQSCFTGGRPGHVVENINNKNKLNAWLKGARARCYQE